MKKNSEFLIFISLILVGVTFPGCQPAARETKTPLKITAAVRPSLDSGLIAIADEKGYFKEAGVDVTLKFYPAGAIALDVMCKGEAQLSTVADIAFAAKLLDEKSIRAIAAIGYSTGSQVVARKDRGILKPSDLKGKKIGYVPETTSQYFLHTFLIAENVSPSLVKAVALSAGDQAQALIDGNVDAVSAFDVFAFEAVKRLGNNVVSWDCQKNLGYQWILAADQSVIQNPEPARRVLKALIQAEKFVLANEDEAKTIIVRRLGLDPDVADQGWPKVRLSVSFNQSVLTSLRDFVRWKMRMDKKEGAPPEVLDFIYTGALDEVLPGSVTVLR